MAVVLLDGVDLFHGHGIEAHSILQFPVVVEQWDANRHNILVGMVDGLGGSDFFLLPNDLRGDAGRKGSVGFQFKGGFSNDGVVGETEVLLIGLADSQNNAICV